MDAHELVKDGGPTVYEWLNSIQYAPWRDPGYITARSSIAEWKQAQARKFEVPDRMKPYVGADTITPEEASFVCRQIDFDDYSDPSEGFIHNVNDVYWPFRDVWWACSRSSIKRQFDATKTFASTRSGRGGSPAEPPGTQRRSPQTLVVRAAAKGGQRGAAASKQRGRR